MSDHTIHIETLPDLTRDGDVLERFKEAMLGDRVADRAACMLDVASGSLSATFHVDARGLAHAIELGVKAFYRGLDAAGFDVDRPGWRLLIDAREGGDPLDPVPRRYELEKLVTGIEVAERLGVSRRSLGQLTDSEDFPMSRGKIGGAVVWLQSDVDAWEALRRQLREDTLRRLEKLGSQATDVELTRRELDVVCAVRDMGESGATNLAIASKLGVSEGTVNRHLNRIYKKLEVNSREEALKRAEALALV